jgi:DNA-binding NtrC family response regulator
MEKRERGFELTAEQIARSRVVLVDDDELVTSSLRSFMSLELELDPIVFNDAEKAAQYVENNELDLIISDFLMPRMDGIQLLARARDRWPEVPRVLLTGYADKENAIKAINEVHAFQYVEKPWENEQLKQIVLNGLERITLIRRMAEVMDELSKTRGDLLGLRKALVRAFA